MPNECCGLLAGPFADSAPGRDAVIDECVPATNIEASPTRYVIDPRDHFALRRRLRGTPRRIVGAYHSHPSSAAVPSASDIAEARFPDFVWVIVSLASAGAPDVRAYRIAGGTYEELVVTE